MLSNFTVKTDYFSIGKDDMAISIVRYILHIILLINIFHQIFEFVTMIKKLDICVYPKEVIKEQPTSRNLSATATRVLLCTYMPCCSF
jgi:hypothetical protein